MKWNNKGHQFDEISEKALDISRQFYIWGAGVAGKAFYSQLCQLDKKRVKGFIDSKIEMQGKVLFDKVEVVSPQILDDDKQAIVVVATLDFIDSIEKALLARGRKENNDFFYSNIFLSILKMYREDKLYMHHLNVHITEKCTYRCVDCSLFIAKNENPHNISLEEVKRNIDLYFQWVDYVQELHIIGGEPLLHPDLIEITSYIGEKYADRIGEFAIATNGTILPSQRLLNVCQQHRTFFTISDYSKSPVFHKKSKINQICSLLEANLIEYRIGDKNQWFDFGNPLTDRKEDAIEKDLLEHFDRCFFRNRVIYQGKLYYCHRQAAGVWAGLSEDRSCNYFSLENFCEDKKKTLMEFELGYNELGYLPFCNGCNGYERINNKFIDAARQLD